MAIDFSKVTWADEISQVTGQKEYQTCEIEIRDHSQEVDEYNYDTGAYTVTGTILAYEGQARFIPVRAGVFQGGEAQLNTTTIRAVRLQIPPEEKALRIKAGMIVTFIDAPGNLNLKGRTAKTNDDFQGSSGASRTFHATMDADSEDT